MGLFMFSQGLIQKIASHDPTPWQDHLTSWMAGVWMWFLLTPVVLWLGRRFPLERKRLWRLIPLHMFFAVLVAIVELSVESAILRSLRVFPAIMSSYAATLAFLFIIGF